MHQEVDERDKWTIYFISPNRTRPVKAKGEGQGDVAALLRRLADSAETVGWTPRMFEFFKRRKPKPDPAGPPPPALGWDAIEDAFGKLYPGQKAIRWAHDGVMRMHDVKTPPENPFDGVSIYDGGHFWHYVSFGMSDLYEKASKGDGSGFGYEFTFRLAKNEGAEDAPLWPIDVMGSVARAAFTGARFATGHTIKMGPIDGREETKATALLIARDPGFGVLDTPHGNLEFLELIGVEADVRERALQGFDEALEEMRTKDKDLVTRV